MPKCFSYKEHYLVEHVMASTSPTLNVEQQKISSKHYFWNNPYAYHWSTRKDCVTHMMHSDFKVNNYYFYLDKKTKEDSDLEFCVSD